MSAVAIQAGADQTFPGSPSFRDRRFGRGKWWGCREIPEGEVFQNRNFDCGVDFWTTNSYGGNMVDNGNGSITFTATDLYSSITQLDKFPIPAGRYHIGVVVSNVSGKGKYAYRTASGWTTAFEFSADGTYEIDIDVSEEITNIDIGAHGDASFTCVFDGVACIDTAAMPMPDWYKIASLDSTDILGVWDMTWTGHGSQSDVMVNLEGSMPSMRVDSGSPTWQDHDRGMNFGGAGSIISDLPDGLDGRDITVIMEYHAVQQKGTLDALYSHYIDAQRYCLQNGWGVNKLRWSVGDSTCTTIEEGDTYEEGIVATAGRNLYHNGTLLGTVPDSGPTSTNNYGFRVGCVWVSSGRTQYSIFKLKKLLIVQRELTESEVQEITNNITNTTVVLTTENGEPLTTENGDKLTL